MLAIRFFQPLYVVVVAQTTKRFAFTGLRLWVVLFPLLLKGI